MATYKFYLTVEVEAENIMGTDDVLDQIGMCANVTTCYPDTDNPDDFPDEE